MILTTRMTVTFDTKQEKDLIDEFRQKKTEGWREEQGAITTFFIREETVICTGDKE